MPTSYPFDPTGSTLSNLITNETHTVTGVNFRDFFFIVPAYAPFYLTNLEVQLVTETDTRTLVNGIDYYTGLYYKAASLSLDIPAYGAIALNPLIQGGTIRLQYQTVGGQWVGDPIQVMERIITLNYNPKITLWDTVTNVPDQFPPGPHSHQYDYVFGQQDLIAAIMDLVTAVSSSGQNPTPYLQHINRTDNPHSTTPAQLGLDLVPNIPLATDDEAFGAVGVHKLLTHTQIRALLSQTLSGLTNGLVSSTDLNILLAAFSNTHTNDLQTHKPLVPPGAIMYFARNTPPGWLPARGDYTIGNSASGATYAGDAYHDLFLALWDGPNPSVLGIQTSTGVATTPGASSAADWSANKRLALPELRGEFIRGWDNGRGIDGSRGLGTPQTDEFKSHTHTAPTATSPTPNGTLYEIPPGASFFDTYDYLGGAPVTETGGAETRPRNIALNACIKY